MSTDRVWHVIVDTKEQKNHDLFFEDSEIARGLPGTFAHEGFSYEFQANNIGDYVVVSPQRPFDPRLVVESKTWDDLHASVRDSGAGRADSRMRHQLAGLLDAQAKGNIAAVMIVGIMTKAGGKGARRTGVYVQNKGKRAHRPWSYYEMEQTCAAIQRLGIMVYRAPSEHEVPATLRHMAELCARDEHFQPPGLPAVASLAPRLSFLATLLTAVPGVNRSRAMPIALKFKTFPAFFASDVEELQKFQGVGKVMAERIWDHFHNEVADSNVDLSELELEALA